MMRGFLICGVGLICLMALRPAPVVALAGRMPDAGMIGAGIALVAALSFALRLRAHLRDG
ncbi:hypothetical protein DKT77_10365 [Meridianimarinicoccus roseus]|jgi:hypothetical protein|uniref:Uncharacterized protein n=1 Tax=Meridianimarinicoccus roseus TaxID=2072018 RepID=A0A2V2LHG1_9RHOB|nr:hypothetical protein [Meridianimarinicoccus roseus]PWR02587.1 hypothetical protein DKT77_10365 [Meridianimarinicoccus roseus]